MRQASSVLCIEALVPKSKMLGWPENIVAYTTFSRNPRKSNPESTERRESAMSIKYSGRVDSGTTIDIFSKFFFLEWLPWV